MATEAHQHIVVGVEVPRSHFDAGVRGVHASSSRCTLAREAGVPIECGTRDS